MMMMMMMMMMIAGTTIGCRDANETLNSVIGIDVLYLYYKTEYPFSLLPAAV